MTEAARIRCAEAHQATAITRVFCTHTSSSSRPRMASTSMVSRKSVLTSNAMQPVQAQDAGFPARTP